MNLISNRTVEQDRQTALIWWRDMPGDRGVIFPSEESRRIWVNSFHDEDTRTLAARMTFTADGRLDGRDDVKEWAIVHANETLPKLFRRLGVPGGLGVVIGTSWMGAGW